MPGNTEELTCPGNEKMFRVGIENEYGVWSVRRLVAEHGEH